MKDKKELKSAWDQLHKLYNINHFYIFFGISIKLKLFQKEWKENDKENL